MSAPNLYAEPRQVDRAEDCAFYHRVEIPGYGAVGDQWDLRGTIDDYLGRFDFRGKRILDVGTASGYLTFAMEQRGAEVVSFDMPDGAQWNLVPFASQQSARRDLLLQCRATHHRMQNAYWFSHRRLGSKARVHYGDIYDLPMELGRFDAAVFGMILSHLRDPLQALYSVSRLVSGSMIVTNPMNLPGDEPIARLMPSADNPKNQCWWILSKACLKQHLAVLGFQVNKVIATKPVCLVKGRQGPEEYTCLVADRVAGQACLPEASLPKAA